MRASVADFRNMSGHYNSLISCCGHLGLTDEVQEYLAARSLLGPPMRLSVLREHIPVKFANRRFCWKECARRAFPSESSSSILPEHHARQPARQQRHQRGREPIEQAVVARRVRDEPARTRP